MIQFLQASKRYPSGHDALLNVSFEMQQGEMAFLTGHSGAGKSTLLKLIALIERTSRGQVIINGENTNKVKTRRIPYFRRNIGIIFHRFLSGIDFVSFQLRQHHLRVHQVLRTTESYDVYLVFFYFLRLHYTEIFLQS